MDMAGMKEAKADIKLRNELNELYKHPTFKKVFLDGYFTDEPARIAQALCNPVMQDEIDQRSLDEMLRGIGHCQNFLLEITKAGNTGEYQIKEAKEQEAAAMEHARLEDEGKIVIDNITGDEMVYSDQGEK